MTLTAQEVEEATPTIRESAQCYIVRLEPCARIAPVCSQDKPKLCDEWLQNAERRMQISGNSVRITLAPATPHIPNAHLRVEQPAALEGVGTIVPTDVFAVERAAHVIPLSDVTTQVLLRPGS